MCFYSEPEEVANLMDQCSLLIKKACDPRGLDKDSYDSLVKSIEKLALELDGVVIKTVTPEENGSTTYSFNIDHDALVHSFM